MYGPLLYGFTVPVKRLTGRLLVLGKRQAVGGVGGAKSTMRRATTMVAKTVAF